MTKEDIRIVEKRFFIDHGMIHDRVTGKHVCTEPVEFEEDQFDASPTLEACALLNSLAAPDPIITEMVEALERARSLIRVGGVKYQEMIEGRDAIDTLLAKVSGK